MERFNGPLFVIGNPRSGTSVLRLALTCHSKINIPPECGFIVWLVREFGDWCPDSNQDIGRIRAFTDKLLMCRKFDTWSMGENEIESNILTVKPRCYAELCELIYRSYGSKTLASLTLWGDKNNFHLHHLDALIRLYPCAKFLHIVRDGRDVACSYREVMSQKSESAFAPMLPIDVLGIAKEWNDNVIKIETFMDGLDGDQKEIVHYEDFVQGPEEVLERICGWLGTDFEHSMLQFYERNSTELLEPQLTIDWKKKTLKPIDSEGVGRYISQLSYSEIADFNLAASDGLKMLGYA